MGTLGVFLSGKLPRICRMLNFFLFCADKVKKQGSTMRTESLAVCLLVYLALHSHCYVAVPSTNAQADAVTDAQEDEASKNQLLSSIKDMNGRNENQKQQTDESLKPFDDPNLLLRPGAVADKKMVAKVSAAAATANTTKKTIEAGADAIPFF